MTELLQLLRVSQEEQKKLENGSGMPYGSP
jgi:hypothetical protein